MRMRTDMTNPPPPGAIYRGRTRAVTSVLLGWSRDLTLPGYSANPARAQFRRSKMPAFDSIAKKLAIPMVVLFEFGWIIYTGGLGSFLHQQVLETTERSNSRYSSYSQQGASDAQEVLSNPVLFSHYFALAGGQFVAVLFLIHAALPLNTASYVVGVLSSIMNIIYFVSVGYLINWSVTGVRIYEDTISTLQEYPYSSSESLRRARLYLHAIRCVLAGTIIMAISWGIIQLLTFFYKPPQNKTDLWQVVREFSRNLSTSTSQVKAKLGELIRLGTIPLLILSTIGWAVCAAGLYRFSDSISSLSSRSTSTTYQTEYNFGTWATFFVTPLLYFAALFHAGCSGGASTMSGVFAAIFNVFFVLNMGSTVVTFCVWKYTLDQESFSSFSDLEEIIHNIDLGLGGGIVCLLFWTIVHTAWLFYRFDRSPDHDRLQSNGDAEHSQPIVHAQQNELYGPGDTGTTTAHSMASFVPGQQVQVPPPYAKHLESEMQPVAN